MNDEELRGLQERVALIKQMSEMPGWEIACDRARASAYIKQKQILLGRCETLEDYKTTVAWLDGLNFFMTIPEVVEKELEVELANREEE